MRPRDVADYAFLALAWGLSFLLVLKVVAAFGWIGAVTLRALVAGITLAAAGALAGRRLGPRSPWAGFAVVGATTVAGQLTGLSYAAPRIGTAMTAIFVATIPLLAMLIGQVWGIERIGRRGLAGLCLGIAGVVMLVGFPEAAATAEFALGSAMALAGAAAAAFGSCYASRKLRGVGSWETTTGAFLCGGAMTLPLLVFVPVPGLPGPGDVAALLTLGAVMSAMTYVAYFRLVAAIGPTRAISVEFAVTVVAVGVGASVLGERLSVVQWAGGAVILAGCALVLGLVSAPARRG